MRGVAERTVRAVFDAVLSELPRILAMIRDFAQQAGLPEDYVVGLELASDEALTNIIRYAYPDREGTVQLRLTEDRRGVYIELIDEGPPFDPTCVPLINAKTTDQEALSNGFGLLLINHFTDALQYTRSSDGRNHFTLIRLKTA